VRGCENMAGELQFSVLAWGGETGGMNGRRKLTYSQLFIPEQRIINA